MNPEQKRDQMASLIYSYLALKGVIGSSSIIKENEPSEIDQLMQEIEVFNLKNAIDKALDDGDKEAFMRLTGELNERITVSS